MKKLLIITMIVSMMVMGGCSSVGEVKSTDNSRFKGTGEEFKINGWTYEKVIDTETKVIYLQHDTWSGDGTLCLWLDADGKPMKAGE